jgi:hypothetical protein
VDGRVESVDGWKKERARSRRAKVDSTYTKHRRRVG